MDNLRLGKKPATYDKHDLRFADFRTKKTTSLPTAPIGFGHYELIQDWGMLGNGPDDTVEPGFEGAGDCVFADAGHSTMLFNKIAGKDVVITGKEAIADYSAVTGYVIGDDSTDQGTDMREALNYRRHVGTLAKDGSRHKIGGYVALEPTNWSELLEALNIFDIVSIGIEFPASAMDQFNAGKPWTYVRNSPIEGGHDIPVVGRPHLSELDCLTWAQVEPLTRSFYQHYSDEAYGILSKEDLVSKKSPEGFDWSQLVAAIKEFPS